MCRIALTPSVSRTDIHDICPTLTEMIIAAAKENKGTATLGFTVVDRSDDVKIKPEFETLPSGANY